MFEYPNGDGKTGKVILLLYGGYHTNCNLTLSLLDNVCKRHKDIKFIKINTSKYYKIKERFNVKILPCVIYLNDDVELGRVQGSLNYHLIEQLILRNE